MKLYLKLLKFVVPYLFYLTGAILCMTALALSTGAMAYLIGPVLKFLFTNEGGDIIKAIPFGLLDIDRTSMIIVIPMLIIAVAVVKGVSFFGQSYLMGYVGQRVVLDIRDRLYKHILAMPVPFFTKTHTGSLISRVTNDVNQIQSTATDSLASLIRESLTIIVLAAVVIKQDWKLAAVAFIAFPLAVYPMIRFSKKLRKVSLQGQTAMGTITSLLQEAISGIRIVKAFCMETYEELRFNKESERLNKLQMKSIKVRAISVPMMEMFGIIGFAATIWYASYRINMGDLTPEGFISFFVAVLMLYQPIRALSGVNLNIQRGLAAASRIFEVLEMQQEIKEREGSKELNGVKNEIEFRDIRLKSLRENIAIVSQQVVLFNDTVKRNIAYGDFIKTDAEIIEASKAANAHGFISRLPEGYDTMIGEGGVRLSGGERQRLSIARAILKNAPILILDEATSSLDTESEIAVQNGLNNLMQGRTTFVIAHRLSTVRNADRIIVLAHGRIKEEGRHEELLRLNGEYSRIYAMQFHDIRKEFPEAAK